MTVLEIAIAPGILNSELPVVTIQFVGGRDEDIVVVKGDATQTPVGTPALKIDIAGVPVDLLLDGLVLKVNGEDAAVALTLLTTAHNGGRDQLWKLNCHRRILVVVKDLYYALAVRRSRPLWLLIAAGDSLEFHPFKGMNHLDIEEPIRRVGSVVIGDLREAVDALPPQGWLESQSRHRDCEVKRWTQVSVLIDTDGQSWPDITLTRGSGWKPLSEAAMPLIERIILHHYTPGGTILRAMVAKLLPGEVILPHRDRHPSYHCSHHIHVPIKTNPGVRFIIDGRPYAMKVGEAYEINNQKDHNVMNKGDEEQIHLMFDYLPLNLIDNSSGVA
jgi:hypothetical protein